MPRIVPSLDTAPRDNLRHLLSVAPVIAALSIGSEIFVPIAVAILLSVALGALLAVQLRCLADGMPRDQSTMLAEIEPLRELLSGGGMSRFSDFVSGLGHRLHDAG